RWATYNEDGSTRDLTVEEKQSPDAVVLPRYWVSEGSTATGEFDKNGDPIMEPGVQTKLEAAGWDRDWLLGWRDICRVTDERTMINAVFPLSAAPDGTLLMMPRNGPVAGLVSCLTSFVLDFTARQKVGGTHLKFFTAFQLPIISPRQISGFNHFIDIRLSELFHTGCDMTPFARHLGDEGGPFRWDEERRSVMRAELDALLFHLYGINRDDVDYIMETFPIVKRKDVEKHGTYRTKERILEIYDRMAGVGVSEDQPLVDGDNFVSELTPPPGHGPRHVPA